MRPATPLLGLVLVTGLLAACGTDTDSSSDSSSDSDPGAVVSPSATLAPSGPTSGSPGPASPTPEFPRGTGRQTGRGSGEPLVFTGVRVAAHEGFDRIVLEFSGTGSPGWGVNYVDRAVMDGSGEVVALDGDSTLDIYASHTTAPAPGYYSGPRRITGPGVVAEVYVVGTFEGDTQVLAGIDGPRAPYRVFTLSDPARLVLDVED